MPFYYKKEYKEFYLPKDKPSIVTVPSIRFKSMRTNLTIEGCVMRIKTFRRA